MQELVALKPLRVPNWIDQSLGLLPYVYLGAAVLFSATGSVFLICAYDPFVGLFRLSASTSMLILGACFLVIGLFVGRPYCRYLCPYGAILGLCSKVSKRHVRIPPEECIQCRLCEDACPYGAILEPSVAQKPADRRRARTRLAALLALSPVLVAAGYLLGSGLGLPFSKLHPTVRLAEYVAQAEPAPDPTGLDVESPRLKQRNDALEAFRNTGRPARDLLAEALALRQRFQVGGAWLGAWVGLVVAVKLLHLSIRRRRTDYQPDKANCVSCGRCFWYCPHEQLRLGLIETLPTVALPVAAAQRDGDSSAPAHPGGRRPMNPETSQAPAVEPRTLRTLDTDVWALTARRATVVATAFALVTAGFLLGDYSRRLVKDPLDSTEFLTLKQQLVELKKQPPGEEVQSRIQATVEAIRASDLALREAYFRQRNFARRGAWLLLAAIVILVIAAKTAATLRRSFPRRNQPSVRRTSMRGDRTSDAGPLPRWGSCSSPPLSGSASAAARP